MVDVGALTLDTRILSCAADELPLSFVNGWRRLSALVSGEDLSTVGGREGLVPAIAAGDYRSGRIREDY
jgi:hypothetical protein